MIYFNLFKFNLRRRISSNPEGDLAIVLGKERIMLGNHESEKDFSKDKEVVTIICSTFLGASENLLA
jgi:hypothetical protein